MQKADLVKYLPDMRCGKVGQRSSLIKSCADPCDAVHLQPTRLGYQHSRPRDKISAMGCGARNQKTDRPGLLGTEKRLVQVGLVLEQ